jgi:hypothetical protein
MTHDEMNGLYEFCRGVECRVRGSAHHSNLVNSFGPLVPRRNFRLQAERNQLREAVEILSKFETKAVQFGLANNQPHGRVFVNRNRGLIFVGARLPRWQRT